MFGWQPWKPITINELMSPGVHWIDPDASVGEAAVMMRDAEVGSLPVAENGRLVGVVTDRDITCRAVANGASPSSLTVRQVMTPGVVYCYVDQPVADAAWIMREKRVRRLPVFSRDNRMMGLLAIADIARNFPILSGRVIETARKERTSGAAAKAEDHPKPRSRLFAARTADPTVSQQDTEVAVKREARK